MSGPCNCSVDARKCACDAKTTVRRTSVASLVPMVGPIPNATRTRSPPLFLGEHCYTSA